MAAGLRNEVDAAAAPGGPRLFVTSEVLFDALDGRTIAGGGHQYRIQVFCVRDDAGHRWIQLALLRGGETHVMLTVRLSRGDSAQRVTGTLTSWLADPSSVTNVVSVA